jgi:hypothetical protein
MFMGCQNTYCANDYTAEINIQIKFNSHDNSNDIVTEIEKHSKIHMENTKDPE